MQRLRIYRIAIEDSQAQREFAKNHENVVCGLFGANLWLWQSQIEDCAKASTVQIAKNKANTNCQTHINQPSQRHKSFA